jgi:hypothetical protein
MSLTKMVDGREVVCSPEEESSIRAEWEANDLKAAIERADAARLAEVDGSIRTVTLGTVEPKTLAQLEAMTLQQYGDWFDANFDTAAKLVGLVRRLTLVILRRCL